MDEDRRIISSEMNVVSYSEGNGDEDFRVPLAAFIERLSAALETIPQEHRATADLHVWASGDYAHAYVDIQYDRPETDAEMAERIAQSNRWKRENEESERRQYLALKAKFEPV